MKNEVVCAIQGEGSVLNQKVLWHLALRQTVNGTKGKTPREELLETAASN
jgi:hypothetical protein